ncbi:hypothetical protein BGZ58_008240 [Dissophora ornata]|nr:hypothetical protein BGZ58_008240 [Dissophora ornata]
MAQGDYLLALACMSVEPELCRLMPLAATKDAGVVDEELELISGLFLLPSPLVNDWIPIVGRGPESDPDAEPPPPPPASLLPRDEGCNLLPCPLGVLPMAVLAATPLLPAALAAKAAARFSDFRLK